MTTLIIYFISGLFAGALLLGLIIIVRNAIKIRRSLNQSRLDSKNQTPLIYSREEEMDKSNQNYVVKDLRRSSQKFMSQN